MFILVLANYAHARPAADTLLNSSEVLSFDIPALPLGAALDIYSETAQLSVLLSVPVSKAALAPSVRGTLTRKQALATLLAGSGLVAYFISNRSIVVRPPYAENTGTGPSTRALRVFQIPGVHQGLKDHSAYVAIVQRTVLMALCASERTRPGNYRLAMQLWINPQGRLSRLNRLGSTGHALRDQAIEHTLIRLSIPEYPDPSMPQPVLIVLLPVADSARLDCPLATRR